MRNSSLSPIQTLRSLRLGLDSMPFAGIESFAGWSSSQLGAASIFIFDGEVTSQFQSALDKAIDQGFAQAGSSVPSIRRFCQTYSTAAADWTKFASDIASGALDDLTLGAWLMSVTVSGLNEDTTFALTRAMAASGGHHDYRSFVGGRFLRRYPTGALSEKIALIMPVVLLYLKELYGVDLKSPFLIARALGHTGGTRDKLAAIPNFRLPEAGRETIALLAKLGVCYVATSDHFNPADDRLYSLRSSTNTIESEALIIASIASKMLSCPVDLMQLDARWGEGAFFSSRESAERTARSICQAISVDGQKAFATITGAHQPDGSALGATAEVAEALSCLRNMSSLFDYRGVSYQQRLVADFSARLVGELFSMSISSIYADVLQAFADGSLQTHFIKLMAAHGVSESYASALWADPLLELRKLKQMKITASCSGRLRKLDQVAIGEFLKENFRDWSIVQHGRAGDFIQAGDPLFDLYVPHDVGKIYMPDANWAIMEA